MNYTTEDNETIKIGVPYCDVIADYQYDYDNGKGRVVQFGKQLYNGEFTLEGFTSIKDDLTGEIQSAMLYIPRLRLASGIELQLGVQANINVASFQGVALPYGNGSNKRISDFIMLYDDVNTDE